MRVEAEGEMSNVKVQMTKSKSRDLWETGKTSSEHELYFFDNHSQATSGKKPSSGLKGVKRLNRRKNMFEWRRASFFEASRKRLVAEGKISNAK